MANGFLVPFATGALTELQRQKQVSDEIAASVVDNVSKHVLGVEIPAERKLIKSQENLKNQYATTYGQKVADGMDAMGLFESGTEEGLFNSIRMRFGDRYNIEGIANKIDKASDEDYNKLIQTSFIGSRKSALQDRGAYIDSVLKDTKNIKDLLVGETPKGLARFIGEPLGRKDEATATARLTQALEGPSPQPAEPSDAASLLGLRDVDTDLEKFDIKKHNSQLDDIRQDFRSVVTDRIMRDNKEFANVFPQFAEDYSNAIKFAGYTGTEEDYYREKYTKQQFKLSNINYDSRVDKIDERAKENIQKGEARVKSAGLDTKTSGVTKEQRGDAFAFGDLESAQNIDYALKLDAINISFSNGVAKILADPALTDEQREAAIKTLEIAVQKKKQELGPPPKETMGGPLAP